MSKIWRDIVGYEKYYEVSNYGDIRNKLTGKELALSLKRNGYLSVDLRYGEPRTVSVHRIVAIAFVENPCNLPCVNHKNEIKTDNSSDNLEWCTQKYNANYGYGANARNTSILQFDMNGNFVRMWTSIKEAAEALGIKYQGISRVCRGERKASGGFKWEYVQEFEAV